jgi:hypothetical protein
VELASGLNATTYDDFPMGNQFGWGGIWCYGVTATVNGTESGITIAPINIFMGLKYYFLWQYRTADCSTTVPIPANGTLVIMRTRNGVTENMPAHPIATQPGRWFGKFRAMSTDKIVAQLTLPDGKVITIPNLMLGGMADGTPLNSNDSPFITVALNRATDGFCSVSHWAANYQHAGNN